jgi:hypothetical protein
MKTRMTRAGALTLAVMAVCWSAWVTPAPLLALSPEQAEEIGRRIWQNEGRGLEENLTVWNAGEDFPSFGIGHFIWYPAGVTGPFEESFPGLIVRLRERGHGLPPWLAQARHAPWKSREDFLAVRNGAELSELRQLLGESIAEQTAYIIERMEAALPRMLDAAPPAARAHIESQFRRLLADPRGVYALIDYVNFKGDGSSPRERYRGDGWGLLQVLERMDPDAEAIPEFVKAADYVLTRRVANAGRDESRWLPGWRKRLSTYLE